MPFNQTCWDLGPGASWWPLANASSSRSAPPTGCSYRAELVDTNTPTALWAGPPTLLRTGFMLPKQPGTVSFAAPTPLLDSRTAVTGIRCSGKGWTHLAGNSKTGSQRAHLHLTLGRSSQDAPTVEAERITKWSLGHVYFLGVALAQERWVSCLYHTNSKQESKSESSNASEH